VDRAIEVITADPGQGDRKKGDFSELDADRFRTHNQLYLNRDYKSCLTGAFIPWHFPNPPAGRSKKT